MKKEERKKLEIPSEHPGVEFQSFALSLVVCLTDTQTCVSSSAEVEPPLPLPCRWHLPHSSDVQGNPVFLVVWLEYDCVWFCVLCFALLLEF